MLLKKNKLHIKFINKIMLIKFIALQNYHKILPCFALIWSLFFHPVNSLCHT